MAMACPLRSTSITLASSLLRGSPPLSGACFRHFIDGSLALASLNLACRNPVPTFPQRSPPSLLTTAACGGLRSTPDCRPRRTSLHLSYSCAAPCGPAILVTQDPNRTMRAQIGVLHSPP